VWNETAVWFFGKTATAQQYWETFQIDPQQFPDWWLETGRDTALPGVAQARTGVQPIFTLRKSHRGRFYPVRQEIAGFCSPDDASAWVATHQWETLLGENTFEQINANADRVRRRALQAKQTAAGRQKDLRATAKGRGVRRG
jgi:hypothetical protein